MKNYRTWTDEQLKEIVSNSTSLANVLRSLGIRPAGGNFNTIKQHINRSNLSIAHFKPNLIRRTNLQDNSLQNLLKENSNVKSYRLKQRLIKEKILENKCIECGLQNSWNDKELVLQLDHKNGIHNDNRLENLRILCPNCHSQTKTFAGRNSKKRENIF